MEQVITTNGLCKSYPMGKGQSQNILSGINLEIRRGEFVAVMGASGSGKSTLLYNISGMDRPSGGSVTLMGNELSRLKQAQLSKLRLTAMGYVFQQSHLLKNLSIFDNIVLPAYRAGQENRKTVNKRAAMLMEHLGIAQIADNDITQASGGQLQRASICRALINNPQILFGDEPTGALNSGATEEVMDILAEINESGTTIVLVTHDPKVAARCERVLYMKDGRIETEISLGKYGKGEQEKRAERLSGWLHTQGF